MNLLPKSHDEFRSADYWEKFFKKRGEKAFEWYGEYPELCSILHKYIKPSEKILVIGCGNSNLSADMYDVGYHNITNIDISETVIRQMKQKNSEKRPLMQFIQMDATATTFEDGEFGAVLDKGTLDALMTDSSADVSQTVTKMFDEISRVLKFGGRYVCVSLAQKHIVEKVLQYFPDQGWPVRICRVDKETGEALDPESEFQMPVFVYVFTRFKKMPNMKPILEVAYFEDKVERCSSVDSVLSSIEEMQHYAMIRQRLGTGCIDENLSVQLFAPGVESARYTLYVVDSTKRSPNKFGIFIVPEGRETEWLFVTSEGRSELLQNSGFQRLVVVLLNRDHKYVNMEEIKAELSGKVMELAPGKISSQGLRLKVPFLTIGDDINTRNIQYRGNSKFSGDFVVEDVECDGAVYRRLVFMSSKMFVQSEAQLVKGRLSIILNALLRIIFAVVSKRGKKKSTKMEIDANNLSMGYQGPLLAGIALVDKVTEVLKKQLDLVLVGLGGGSLSLFLLKNFSTVKQDVVDIDSAMVDVARKWFGLTGNASLRVTVADGIDFIRELSTHGTKKHVVIVDVDCKDPSLGISAPPQSFMEEDFLKCIDSILHPGGVLLLNLACRNQSIRTSIISQLKSVFQQVFVRKISGDVNECVYCTCSRRNVPVECSTEAGLLPQSVQRSADELTKLIKGQSAGVNTGLVLAEELQGLSIL
ncbi:hypothetical protein CAPTEDRAFT_136807 [Capitella teleta]|uniref:Methyltransferase type 11 domain-containing protein n=1 Tax=Capitella teleta TaxID=283909 RepID=R7U9P1_CAPTE|nr:hypothetical protein CAPTEDRAFT_136807 [Capitella teleta]|eukprot:ELU00523.1 hypothetical protein CAPTEDRAFT_136807 [Capitella teleta]